MHIREKRANASGTKDLNKSDIMSNPSSAVKVNHFTPRQKYYTTEEKATANLDFGTRVDMAQRKQMFFLR